MATEVPSTSRVDVNNYGDYLDHQMTNTFTEDQGLVVVPIADRVSGHRVIRLHGGVGTRTVNWKTTRMGKPPIAPAAENGDEDTFLGSTFGSQLPVPNRAGGYDWSMSGSYTYVQNNHRVPGYAAFPVGDYPFVVIPAMVRAKELATPFVQDYAGDEPFQSFVSACWDGIPYVGNDIEWPILAFPAQLFSHAHMI